MAAVPAHLDLSERLGARGSTANFKRFQVTTFPELDEPPDYFLKELKQDKQMNFQELERYIAICSRAVSTPCGCACSFTRSFPCRCSR